MMSDEQKSVRAPDQVKTFQIRIQGHLSQQWTDWFAGLTIRVEEDGNTLLSGPVVDQSALHGILKRIRDLGMPLLSVNSDDFDQAAKTDSDHIEGDL
jgi:hypothetical protein